MNFDQAFDLLMGHEGQYSNNAADPGGETMWGITAKVARASGYVGDMRALPRDTAKAIARAQYWLPSKADILPDEIQFDMFDTAYNSGVTRANKLLQLAVGVPDDGVVGPQTLRAVAAQKPLFISMRFNAERLMYLTSLPTWGAFGKGWARRVAVNLRTATGA